MQTDNPLVSIIAIHYNHLADTIEFLESATRLTYQPVEIIVVDNASQKEAITDEVKTRFSTVKFKRTERNLGFAGGNNVGMQWARGEYFFFLNNDTLLPEGLLEPIIAFMRSHPDAGMASPKVLYPDKVTIQYAGAVGINPMTGRGKRIGLFEKDSGQYDRNYKTDLGHGAALIVPRKVADLIGPMPEIYFLYYEEHDWCMTARRNGYNMYYLGCTHVIHKESISTGGDESPQKTYYLTRNRLLFMRRNFSGSKFLAGVIFFVVLSIPKNVLGFLLKGRTDLVKAYFKGVGWNLTTRMR
jgi:GT2 family glycosyltransferase